MEKNIEQQIPSAKDVLSKHSWKTVCDTDEDWVIPAMEEYASLKVKESNGEIRTLKARCIGLQEDIHTKESRIEELEKALKSVVNQIDDIGSYDGSISLALYLEILKLIEQALNSKSLDK